MPSEVRIVGCDSLEVFTNERGGITIAQEGYEGEQVVGLSVDAARRLAAALLEIANEIEPDKGERETHGTSPA